MKIKAKLIDGFLVLATALVFAVLTIPLGANGIELGVEFIKGTNLYELDPMTANDSFYTPDGAGRNIVLDSGWKEKEETPVLVSLFYVHDIGPVSLFGGIRQVEFKPQYTYADIRYDGTDEAAPNMHALPLGIDVSEKNQDIEVGVRIPIGGFLVIAPKAGVKKEEFKATFAGIGVGNELALHHSYFLGINKTLDGTASGNYYGVDLEFKLGEHFSILAGYTPYLKMTGDKSESEIEFEMLDNGEMTAAYGLAGADALVTGRIASIGFKYKLTHALHFHVGYLVERFNVSYPAYTNYLHIAYDSTLPEPHVELFPMSDAYTDFTTYGKEGLREKRHIVLAVTYDITFGKAH